MLNADGQRLFATVVVSFLGGLRSFDFFLQIDIRDSLVEIEAEALRFFLLHLSRRTRQPALGFRQCAGDLDDIPALGTNPSFARVFVADLERLFARGAKDVDRQGSGPLIALCPSRRSALHFRNNRSPFNRKRAVRIRKICSLQLGHRTPCAEEREAHSQMLPQTYVDLPSLIEQN